MSENRQFMFHVEELILVAFVTADSLTVLYCISECKREFKEVEKDSGITMNKHFVLFWKSFTLTVLNSLYISCSATIKKCIC